MNVQVTVTQQYIDEWVTSKSSQCPFQRALYDYYSPNNPDLLDVGVGYTHAVIYRHNKRIIELDATEQVHAFICSVDYMRQSNNKSRHPTLPLPTPGQYTWRVRHEV